MMKRLLVLPLALAAALAGGAAKIVEDQCGPFTDVTPAFCPYILELYYLGITVGTSATTYSPDDPLTRGQAAVFISRGLNQSLARSSRRAALGQWWTTQSADAVQYTDVGFAPFVPASDGTDVWVPNSSGDTISRVRGSDGKLLENWTGAAGAVQALAAMGRVFVTGTFNPGRLYMLDPSQPPGDVTLVAGDLGGGPEGIAFDGSRIWTANSSGSVSIVTPGSVVPWSSTTIPGFTVPVGVLFDGANIWITDALANALLKLDANGAVLQTVPVGVNPFYPVFDGANIWVPNDASNSVTVVSASTGAVVATLTGNGLAFPLSAAFDGQRILVVNGGIGASVSLWRAADLSPLGFVSLADKQPYAACSDGISFWITIINSNQLARF
jgi:hypothetical protein